MSYLNGVIQKALLRLILLLCLFFFFETRSRSGYSEVLRAFVCLFACLTPGLSVLY